MRVKCDVILIALVSLVLLVLNFACTSNRSNLWILSGQSNACGRGALPGPKGVAEVRMFAVDEGRHDPGPGQWETAQDPLPGMETWGVSAWVAAGQAWGLPLSGTQ